MQTEIIKMIVSVACMVFFFCISEIQNEKKESGYAFTYGIIAIFFTCYFIFLLLIY